MRGLRAFVPLAVALLLGLGGIPAGVSARATGTVRITGSMSFTDPTLPLILREPVFDLWDLHGFITRDPMWLAPASSQILGRGTLDGRRLTGTYTVDLPIEPEGILNKVDHSNDGGAGVQVFAANYAPNLTGTPYLEGNDRDYALGWPTDLASIVTDSENHDEVTGGKLIVWAPDSSENFPTGFGADGLLFTADDPINTIPAGWSVVDLDQKPFRVSTNATEDVQLYESASAAVKDYSGQSYVDSFDSLFHSVSTNWAFNGVPSKHIDWQGLHDRVRPKVVAAQAAHDPAAFEAALAEFINSIPDGHSSIVGDLESARFGRLARAGYGFSLIPLGNGRFTVIFVTRGSPAEKAGLKVGAVVTKFNGRPIAQAVAAVVPPVTDSEPAQHIYQQARYLLRAPVGRVASVTFANPGGTARTVKIRSIEETDSLRRTSIHYNAPPATTPVEFTFLQSGAGYVRVNTNFDDLHLILSEFQYALTQFSNSAVTDIVIDLRYNDGGVTLGFAGFLSDQTIDFGTLEYYSQKTGQFEATGHPDRVIPKEPEFRFAHIAVLVGPACFSACELEAYALAQLPQAMVVGMYPSAGVEAEVSQGQYTMPAGISIQIPTGRFVNPDGSLFLEGVGVQPTIRVPLTLANVRSSDDVVLKAAERALAAAH